MRLVYAISKSLVYCVFGVYQVAEVWQLGPAKSLYTLLGLLLHLVQQLVDFVEGVARPLLGSFLLRQPQLFLLQRFLHVEQAACVALLDIVVKSHDGVPFLDPHDAVSALQPQTLLDSRERHQRNAHRDEIAQHLQAWVLESLLDVVDFVVYVPGVLFVKLPIAEHLDFLHLRRKVDDFADDVRLVLREVLLELWRRRDHLSERELVLQPFFGKIESEAACQRDVERLVRDPVDVVLVGCQHREELHYLLEVTTAGVVEYVQAAAEVEVHVDLVSILELHAADS